MTSNSTLYIGGRIRTGDPLLPSATTMLVSGGRVVALGFTEPHDVPAGTVVRDLGGATVLPGFIDAHVHPLMGGLQLLATGFAGIQSVEGYWAELRRLDAVTPPGEWIVAAGYSAVLVARERITRRELDAVIGDRPVLMVNSDLHGGLANTVALRAAGLLDSQEFSSEYVERGDDGAPNGLVNEEAMARVMSFSPPPSEAVAEKALLEAQAHLHSLGVVGWQDALLGDKHGGEDPTARYLALDAAGRITARVSGAIGWDRARGVEQVPDILEHARAFTGARLSAPAVKILLDGVHEAGTASMLAEYNDAAGRPLGNSGPTMIEPGLLDEALVALDAAGLDVHIHALGDRAVRDALDAVDAARHANGHRGTRHQVAHVTFIDPSDVPRFRELDVTANAQLIWVADDFLDFAQYEIFVGPERRARQSALAEWDAAGFRWSAGSDWPVSSAAPLDAITAGSRRRIHGDGPTGPLWQRLPATRIIDAYTSGSAFTSRLDDNGVLRAGSHADFVLLDRDPAGPGPANESTVLETVVAGETVYAADSMP
ncbi:amidohydrolase [Amnibacterium flavum]|uniref:Amidohydrolase n=1 Tax=Amnibacterium flavum TaxID=2173173 RepID=A0A2V1HS21_9MICO|nr:amidohydrolase [Amnibacterium flavum]PVZ95131.1 amidohydrolase [Amnibacterium flavum]